MVSNLIILASYQILIRIETYFTLLKVYHWWMLYISNIKNHFLFVMKIKFKILWAFCIGKLIWMKLGNSIKICDINYFWALVLIFKRCEWNAEVVYSYLNFISLLCREIIVSMQMSFNQSIPQWYNKNLITGLFLFLVPLWSLVWGLDIWEKVIPWGWIFACNLGAGNFNMCCQICTYVYNSPSRKSHKGWL